MSEQAPSFEEVKALLKQAKASTLGGASTASDRFLQHKPLIRALDYVVERYEGDVELEKGFLLVLKYMMASLKKYPVTYAAKEIEYRWAVKAPVQFNEAVERLVELMEKADNIGR